MAIRGKGFHRGLHIVRDGLVLALDAASPRSYPGSGTTWKDLLNSGENGTLTNGPTFDSGNNGSIVLDGVDDYVQVMSDGFGTFNLQEFSLDMWFNVDILQNYNVLFSYDNVSHSNPYYALHIRTNSNGSIGYYYNINGGSSFAGAVSAAGVISANTWHNVCVTSASGLKQVFVDGGLVKQKGHGTVTYYNQEVWIGRSNFSTGYTDGKVAAVKYYNRELTDAEILQNYNALKPRFE